MIETRDGPVELSVFFKRDVGKISKGLEEVFIEATNSVRSFREIWEKLFRVCGRGEQV